MLYFYASDYFSLCKNVASAILRGQGGFSARRDSYEGLFGRVLLGDGEVVVDEFGAVRLQLDGGPHHRVEVGKVVVHVDALVAVATQRPARQL